MEDQTARYLAALGNTDIQILGHPQTRMYNRREGLRADWSRVFAEAARLGKAVEIDGYADRQDLRVSLLKIARQEGTRISPRHRCTPSPPIGLHGIGSRGGVSREDCAGANRQFHGPYRLEEVGCQRPASSGVITDHLREELPNHADGIQVYLILSLSAGFELGFS